MVTHGLGEGNTLTRMPHGLPCCFSSGFSTTHAPAHLGWANLGLRRRSLSSSASLFPCLLCLETVIHSHSGVAGQDVKPLCFLDSLSVSFENICRGGLCMLIPSRGQADGK